MCERERGRGRGRERESGRNKVRERDQEREMETERERSILSPDFRKYKSFGLSRSLSQSPLLRRELATLVS